MLWQCPARRVVGNSLIRARAATGFSRRLRSAFCKGGGNMPHVTFIHGIANKPPADELIRIWRRALESAPDPLPLGSLSVTSSMVYWADLLYAEPEQDTTAFEGVQENTAAAIDGAGGPPPPEPRTPEERAFLDSLRAKMTTLSDEQINSDAVPDVPPETRGQLERVPLP